MTFITGNDISEFQGQIDWTTFKNNANFVIIRAGEGTSYIDKEFANNRTQARNQNLSRGFYHFANPDLGNSAADEAKFFCSLIDGDPIKEGEVLALDYEVTYSDPVGWCKAWLDAVSAHYNGLKPLIYLNQAIAQASDWTPVIDAGYALWIAAYTGDPTKNDFNGGKWQTAALQQWTDAQTVPGISGNVDGDVFFGDVVQFAAYGYKAPVPVQIPTTQATTTPPTPSTMATVVVPDPLLTQAQATIASLNDTIVAKNQQISQLQAQIQTLNTNLQASEMQVATLQPIAAQVPGLKTQLDQAEQDVAIAKGSNGIAQQTITKLNKQVNAIQNGKLIDKLKFLLS